MAAVRKVRREDRSETAYRTAGSGGAAGDNAGGGLQIGHSLLGCTARDFVVKAGGAYVSLLFSLLVPVGND